MKVLLQALVLFFAMTGFRTSSFGDSGWQWQNPLPQGNYLYAVATPDLTTVVAAGDFGTILSTIDGGITWTLQSSTTRNVLLGLSFVCASTGWAVGGSGTILSTTDCVLRPIPISDSGALALESVIGFGWNH
jgi:hypothetical protein